jgi:hypothetical protein
VSSRLPRRTWRTRWMTTGRHRQPTAAWRTVPRSSAAAQSRGIPRYTAGRGRSPRVDEDHEHRSCPR